MTLYLRSPHVRLTEVRNTPRLGPRARFGRECRHHRRSPRLRAPLPGSILSNQRRLPQRVADHARRSQRRQSPGTRRPEWLLEHTRCPVLPRFDVQQPPDRLGRVSERGILSGARRAGRLPSRGESSGVLELRHSDDRVQCLTRSTLLDPSRRTERVDGYDARDGELHTGDVLAGVRVDDSEPRQLPDSLPLGTLRPRDVVRSNS